MRLHSSPEKAPCRTEYLTVFWRTCARSARNAAGPRGAARAAHPLGGIERDIVNLLSELTGIGLRIERLHDPIDRIERRLGLIDASVYSVRSRLCRSIPAALDEAGRT